MYARIGMIGCVMRLYLSAYALQMDNKSRELILYLTLVLLRKIRQMKCGKTSKLRAFVKRRKSKEVCYNYLFELQSLAACFCLKA